MVDKGDPRRQRSSEATVEDVRVSENDRQNLQGGSKEPGTFAIDSRGSSIRITWYYRANGERRTFTLSYRIGGQERAAVSSAA